jgi:HK97 gp10 family phage protein
MIRAKVRGIEELKLKLKKLGKEVNKEMRPALEEAAKIVKEDAKNKAPVRTGVLKKSITVEMVSDQEARIGPGKEGWYGPFIEFGKVGYAPQPFLRPAFDENRQEILNKIKKNLKMAVQRAAR